MTVIKDSSGVYLRLEGKDYFVCNCDKLDNYSGGSNIRATFKKISDDKCECAKLPRLAIYIPHNYGGAIKVISVK